MMINRVVRNVSWVGIAFGLQQVIRLVTNIVLATIVTPSVFGIMLILNTLRTGVEQISDVGIGQNIVFDKMGNRPKFYNTAWTIQIIRGLLLFGAFLLAAPFLATAFGGGELGALLPLFAPIFVITGFATPAIFLMQKNHQIRKLVSLELVIALIGAILAIGFALVSPTAEALVWALLLTSVIAALLGARMMRWRNLRLCLDRIMARRILYFGAWVFVATLLHFAASSFDRLYFAAVIPLSLLGVYGIAKTFADAAFQLAHKISTLIVFPTIADAHHSGAGIAAITKPRQIGVLIAGILIGGGLAFSDIAIGLLYDARYQSAAFILPVLLVGVWFSILSVINESVVYGSGKPVLNAGANAAKFAWLLILVPFAFQSYGFAAALAMISLGDIPRYMVLSFSQSGQKRVFAFQDLVGTTTLLITAASIRWVLLMLGWVSEFLPMVPPQLGSV
ncbi:oligosaccharide flippase family protein [Qipengyuania sphaerica]|uniref:oligosaccharide flippase family protein n=1 Tax=Qipengyuania sphaerica TaxID=2867243 RepID=UPI001C87CD47|nr:oligosaccharide flippase family protein [Qipengyuania sphaerica]MBX7539385.1 oligosaccharide flippase family protein [Qipengyuania sphaerica]